MEELKKINEAGCVREITMDTGVAAGLGKMDAVSETENEIEMERIPDKHRDLQVKGALGMENTIRPMSKPREEDIAIETESDAQNIDSGDSVKINTGGASISPEDELTMAIRAIQPDDDVNMDNNVLKLEEGVEIKEIQDTEVGKKDDYNAVTEETTVLQSRENSSKIVENKCNLPDTRVDSDIPMDLGDDAIVDSNNVVGPTNNISEPLLDLGGNKSYNESEKRKEVGNIDSPENGKDDHVNGDKADNSVMVIEIDDDDDDSTAAIGESSQKAKEDIMASSILTKNKDEGKPQESTSQGMTQEDSEAPTAFESSCKDVGMQEESKILSKDSLNSSVKSMDCEESVTPSAAEDVNLLEETQTQRQTPDSAKGKLIDDDTSGEVFYNKECINYECPRDHKQFFLAPLFALTYFKISRKNKPQYICSTCYDYALEMYEGFVNLLAAKQPMLLKGVVRGKQEFVEIIDSSDEDDDEEKSEKDNTYLSKDDLKLIEEELDNSIKKVLDKVEIQNQLTWSKTILNSRLKALEAETNCIDEELRTLQKKADQMHVALYLSAKVKDRQLASTDANTGRPYVPPDPELKNLPPIGDLQRPPIQINETYYAVKNKAIASWVPCRVMEQVESTIVSQKLVKNYRIKFLKSHYQMVKTVSAKHMAYFNPPSVRLPVGSRVIAYFDSTSLSRGKEKMMIQSAFYPGVIAEPLKPTNRYRYLVFYDDGYTQYVYHKDVRLVCHVSENVWEDVYPGARDFIQNYLTQYSINRPMVQTQKGQSMTTESYGKWSYARVVDIDCSLIQMQFEGAKSHTEWIYRGSLRLGPVFKEYQKTAKTTQMPVSRLPRRTEPFIRYTEDEDETTPQEQHEERERQLQQQNEPRAVAKKSVSRRESSSSCDPAPTVRHLNNSTIYLEDESRPKGKVVYYTAKRNMPPRPYEPHTCKPSCLFPILHNLSAYSPLSKPLLSGWERLIVRQKVKRVISYRGPCGKIVRNMKELHHYLRATKNVLNVENFDFSPETNCLAEYVIDSAIVQMRDISGGQEKMAIPLVNYYDNTMPPECKYAAQRIPTEGVNLNLDEEFLVGCDCEGDCSDKAKCSCWQLTYAGAKYGNPNTPMEEIGYQYKRLYEHVPTGIYECNSRCKCKSNCLNRVVQHSLEMKLQVFKTSNRGWGLRCINDIPRGSFICVYAGHLLTEDRANEGGLDVGDEYFAELDYIEVAEQIKEGYESDVESGEHEDDDDDEIYEQEDDDEFTPSKPVGIRASKGRPQRSTRGSNAQATEEDSQERQMINFNPNANMDENSMRESSIRKLYGKDESCYVMDAKITGNLGRYFNHSCSPNLFVQNVFVDTHDLRFPWVAFFSSTHIRAGTELTWNYNYEVGVVPGKVLYCQCGAPNCRLRLL